MSGRRRVAVGTLADLPPGGRKLVDVDGKTLGVFNVNGSLTAVLNVCPHELAPVCRGKVRGTTLPSAPGEMVWGREGEILVCPWHGWEFDLLTGTALSDARRRLRTFEVTVVDGTIYVAV